MAETTPLQRFTVAEWAVVPLVLKKRWWKETDYGHKPASKKLDEEIAAAIAESTS